MKCTDVRAALPLLIYRDAAPREQAALHEHLAHCAACCREKQALEKVQRLLEAAPAPRVEVDLLQLHRTLADRQMQRAGRWRRIALALGGAAAVLLLVVGLRLEVSLELGRMSVSWGDPPPPVIIPVAQEPPVNNAGLPPESAEAELRVLRALIHALKRDADDRDRRLAEQLDRLQQHVEALQTQGDQRWTTTEQNVAALYLLTRKGERP